MGYADDESDGFGIKAVLNYFKKNPKAKIEEDAAETEEEASKDVLGLLPENSPMEKKDTGDE